MNTQNTQNTQNAKMIRKGVEKMSIENIGKSLEKQEARRIEKEAACKRLEMLKIAERNALENARRENALSYDETLKKYSEKAPKKKDRKKVTESTLTRKQAIAARKKYGYVKEQTRKARAKKSLENLKAAAQTFAEFRDLSDEKKYNEMRGMVYHANNVAHAFGRRYALEYIPKTDIDMYINDAYINLYDVMTEEKHAEKPFRLQLCIACSRALENKRYKDMRDYDRNTSFESAWNASTEDDASAKDIAVKETIENKIAHTTYGAPDAITNDFPLNLLLEFVNDDTARAVLLSVMSADNDGMTAKAIAEMLGIGRTNLYKRMDMLRTAYTQYLEAAADIEKEEEEEERRMLFVSDTYYTKTPFDAWKQYTENIKTARYGVDYDERYIESVFPHLYKMMID